MVAEITDSTNIARAYSLIPITWFLGVSIGFVCILLRDILCNLTLKRPIIGGLLEQPAKQFPAIFGNSSFLKEYPYFLPCAISATFAVMCWFIAALFLQEVRLVFIKMQCN